MFSPAVTKTLRYMAGIDEGDEPANTFGASPSPDGPAAPQTAYQMGAGRNAGGTMFRGPLSQQPELPASPEPPIQYPGDGGFAPQTGEHPWTTQRSTSSTISTPGEPLSTPSSTDPTISDPAYTQPSTPAPSWTYQEIEQSPEALGPAAPDDFPIPPPSPYDPAQQASMEPQPWFGVPEETVTQRVQQTLTQAAQAGADAGLEASKPPTNPQEVASASVPMVRGVQIVQDVTSAFGEVVGRRVAEALGVTDDDLRVSARQMQQGMIPPAVRAIPFVREAAEALGDEAGRRVAEALGVEYDRMGTLPFSGQDIGGFVGSVALDPTNLASGGPAMPIAQSGIRAAQEGAGVAARGARAGARALGEAASGVGARVAEGFQQGRRVAAELNAQPSGSSAYGTFGLTPGQPSRRPTVEVLREQADAAYQAALRAREAGDIDAERAAMDRVWALESQMTDAVNARRDLEPRIVSDVGQRIESMPLDDRTADDFAGLGREMVRPGDAADLGGPSSVIPDTYGRMNATPGLATRAGTDVLARVNADVGSALGSSTFGAAAGLAAPADTPEERRRNALIGAGVGLVGGPVASRALRSRGGALATPGFGSADSSGLGNVPPSQLREPTLPGMEAPPPRPVAEVIAELPESIATPRVQQALSAAEQRRESMERRGLKTPSVWDWIKQAGYAGIYGPATAMNAALGGAQELVFGQPKELARAIATGNARNYGAQIGGQIRALPEGLTGVLRVLRGGGSENTAAASGGSQGTANLSERIVNPVGHAAARALERPGELLTEAPDAVFRPLFTAQGMQREAGRIAAEQGLRGAEAQRLADDLMQQAEGLRLNPDAALATDEARRVVKAGTDYADQMGYKGDSGGLGRWLAQLSNRDDPIGVLAAFLTPFPGMVGRMATAAARSTPGVGLIPSVRRGQPTTFDVVYDQAFGTALAAGMAYWAFRGGVTGSGPADPEQRQMMIDQGWQPNSYVVGDYYIPNRTAGRFQPMLDVAGEIHDALVYGKKDRKASEIAADLVKRGTKIATNQVGLSGISDFQDMLTQGFESRFPGWVARSAIRYLPYGGVSRGIATALDPSQRRPEGWGDEIVPITAVGQNLALAVPGVRQSVPAAQDTLGRESENPQRGIGALAPKVTAQRDDPTLRSFQEAGVDIGRPKTDLGGPQPRVAGARAIPPIPMTPQEQRDWNAARGRVLVSEAQRALADPDHQTATPAQKKARFERILRVAGDMADAEIRGQPEFQQRLRESMEQPRAS